MPGIHSKWVWSWYNGVDMVQAWPIALAMNRQKSFFLCKEISFPKRYTHVRLVDGYQASQLGLGEVNLCL